MFDVMFLGIVVQALLTCLVLFVAARHEADYEFEKVLIVTAGLALANVALEFTLKPRIGMFYLLPGLTITAWAFHDFCWLPWQRAIICTLLLAVLNAGAALGIGFATSWLFGGPAGQSRTVSEQHLADLEDARQAMEDAFREEQVVVPPAVAGATTLVVRAISNSPASPLTVTVAASAQSRTAPSPHATNPLAAATRPPLPADDWPGARSRLRLRGSIRGPDGAPVILIGGQVCASGDLVAVTHNGRRYTWRVESITDKSHDLVPVNCQATR